jgi:Ca2+-transporting ATPase
MSQPGNLGIAPRVGLSDSEAAQRLAADGPNDLPRPGRRSHLRIIADVLREPMFALLLGASVLYVALGDLSDALVLLLFASMSVTIAVVQQGRSERVLDALRELTSPNALVIRSGQRRRVPGRDVVRGDLLVLAEGDRVPADAALISGDDVQVDESLLTGESLPVRKRPVSEPPTTPGSPGGDDLPYVFSGTLMIRGIGLAVATATGPRSEIGKIGSSVGGIVAEPPRLQIQTRRLVLISAAAGLVVSALVVVLYGLLRDSWLEALLAGIAIGMSMLPEEIPLVLTVFMVMGAWRLSQSNVLTRRPTAIETLGAATVLCTDKTGTLTRNQMSVASLQCAAEDWQHDDGPAAIVSSPALARLLDTAHRASEQDALDPMERALTDLATRAQIDGPADGELLHEYPLRPQLLAVTRVWTSPHGGPRLVATKGAPEAIAELCRMDRDAVQELHAQVSKLANRGMRVLGVARAELADSVLPAAPTDLQFEFLGLVGFADPLRDTVPDAVRECRSAGIRVVMITGDYPQTARAIARQAGIDDGQLLTGEQLERLDDAALAQRVPSTTVFARIAPTQKLRIVNALKANGDVVAMTGDGVNDAPALKAAHIGIAMGRRGTDVAREASSIVLLDDDFGSIVRAVRLGRRIHDNLRKAIGYIIAIHVPIAGLALLPILMGLPLLLTPMLIAFLELIIDPACSIMFEAEPDEGDVMNRPPRSPSSSLLSPALLGWSVMQGVLGLLAATSVFLVAVARGMPAEETRAIAFVALIGVNVALIFANRTFSASLGATFSRANPWLWGGLGSAGALLAALLAWPDARAFLRLGPLHGDDLALCLLAVLGLLGTLEFAKARRFRNLGS